MRAIIKATGEIIDGKAMVSFNGDDFYLDELEIIQDKTDKILYNKLNEVYWEKLKHQYVGMAMQGLMANLNSIRRLEGRTLKDEIIDIATVTALALVEKMKEDSKC